MNDRQIEFKVGDRVASDTNEKGLFQGFALIRISSTSGGRRTSLAAGKRTEEGEETH